MFCRIAKRAIWCWRSACRRCNRSPITRCCRRGARSRLFAVGCYPLPNGAVAMVSYSADIEDVDHSKYIDLLTDVKLAIRWCHTGNLQPKLGNYQYVPDFTVAIKFIQEQFATTGKPVRVCLDTETLGLDPYSPLGYIVSVQITYRSGQADVVKFDSREASLNYGDAVGQL